MTNIIGIGQSYSKTTLYYLRTLELKENDRLVLYLRDLRFSERLKLFRKLSEHWGILHASSFNIRIWLKSYLDFTTRFQIRLIAKRRKITLINTKKDWNFILNDTSCKEINFGILMHSPLVPGIILKKMKFALFNVHPGLIPRYRGVDVVRWSLANRECPYISIHKVNERIDLGKVYMIKKLALVKCKSVKDVEQLALKECVDLINILMSNWPDIPIDLNMKIDFDEDDVRKPFYMMPPALRKKLNSEFHNIKFEILEKETKIE